MATVIIFGLIVTSQTEVSITGPTGDDLPPMIVITDSGRAEVAYDPGGKSWSTKLGPDRYVLRIDERDGQEIVEDAKVTLAVAADAPPPTFVSLGKATASGARPIVAWTATSTIGDPKDPWPPPETAIALAADDEKWFADRFAKEAPSAKSRTRSG